MITNDCELLWIIANELWIIMDDNEWLRIVMNA